MAAQPLCAGCFCWAVLCLSCSALQPCSHQRGQHSSHASSPENRLCLWAASLHLRMAGQLHCRARRCAGVCYEDDELLRQRASRTPGATWAQAAVLDLELNLVLLAQGTGWSLGETQRKFLRPVIKMCPAAASEQNHRLSGWSRRYFYALCSVSCVIIPASGVSFVGFPRQRCVLGSPRLPLPHSQAAAGPTAGWWSVGKSYLEGSGSITPFAAFLSLAQGW